MSPREMPELSADQVLALAAVVRAVGRAVDATQPYMAGHAERVAQSADRIGRALGLGQAERFRLVLAARFHDIGMLATPDYLLRKPSALAEHEMEEVRIHPVKGAELFAAEPELQDLARVIRHHHERLDGQGYPDGLAGEAIPLDSRIILVADAFEAMTHHRPYRRAVPPAAALEQIQAAAGAQFDPGVVRHLARIVDLDAGGSP